MKCGGSPREGREETKSSVGDGYVRTNQGQLRLNPNPTQTRSGFGKGDNETAKELISQSIVTILKAGLTQHQRQNLDELKQLHRQEMQDIMESAFQRGWMRDGRPNLSNAMDEVLIEVIERIKQAREEGEVRRLE